MEFNGIKAGLDQPFFLFAGPCVIESEAMALQTAEQLKEITTKLGIPFVYKSSFDKANRSSMESFRGLGMEEGLRILQKVKDDLGVPVITDVHEDTNISAVARVVDIEGSGPRLPGAAMAVTESPGTRPRASAKPSETSTSSERPGSM